MAGQGDYPLVSQLGGMSTTTMRQAIDWPAGGAPAVFPSWFFDAASGGGEILGQANLVLAALSTSSTGTVQIAGAASLSLAAMATSSTGVVEIKGSASLAMGSLVAIGTATLPIVGQSAPTMAAMAITAAGTSGSTTSAYVSNQGFHMRRRLSMRRRRG